jgi:hypothetical protein
MIRTTHNRGVQFTFRNGLTISIQFGAGNLCENRFQKTTNSGMHTSDDAEVCIWDKENNLLRFGENYVRGWCSSDEIAQLINAVQEASDIHSLQMELNKL